MAKLQAPSGFRDFLPAQMRKRTELIERIRRVYESFGFEPMDTPMVVSLAVLLGKGGGENEKLMFRVLKRGADLARSIEQKAELADLGLRYDLTVPLARYYATHRGELPAVFKRYHVGSVFRAERPQHGRFREFVQCDVDILGSRSPLAELEVIVATATALAALGFKDLKVRLNSRPLLTLLVESFGIAQQHVASALIVIDKQDKVGPEELASELAAKGLPSDASAALLAFMVAAKAQSPEDRLAVVAQKVGDAGREHLDRLREILQLLPPLPSGQVLFDPFLARGLDYYTGPIFEVGAEGVPFSLAGGGRFDGLVGALSGADVPAVGFSIGFERVLTVLDQRGALGTVASAADLFVAVPDPSLRLDALALATLAREAGLRVDLYVGTGKLAAQFETAEKKGIGWALMPDAAELAQGRVLVRNLASRENTIVSRSELAVWLSTRLAPAKTS